MIAHHPPHPPVVHHVDHSHHHHALKKHKHRKHRHHKHRRHRSWHKLHFVHLAQIKGPVVEEMMRMPLAATTWMEARNQNTAGRRAVMHVIMNRVKLDKNQFGHGILGVVGKRKHFSCLNMSRDGHMDANRMAFFDMLTKPETDADKIAWRQIQKLSASVGSGLDPDNTGGATFYATATITPYWRYDMTVVGQVGDHVFFRPKTKAEAASYRRDMKANAQLAKARRIARKANRPHKPVMVIKHRIRM